MHKENIQPAEPSARLSLSLLLHDLELANNVGSLFRIADALGVEKLQRAP